MTISVYHDSHINAQCAAIQTTNPTWNNRDSARPPRDRPKKRQRGEFAQSAGNVSDVHEPLWAIRWERYPHLVQTPHARAWLTWLTTRQVARATVDAYGRGLEDFLAFSSQHAVCVEVASLEQLGDHVAAYVCDLARRPVRYARRAPQEPLAPQASAQSRVHQGVTMATVRLRLLCVRQYLHYLIQEHIREDTPFAQDRETLSSWWKDDLTASASHAALPAADTDATVSCVNGATSGLAYRPAFSDGDWHAILDVVRTEPLRNQAMFALVSETGLCRSELCTLRRRDIDTNRCYLRVPSARRLKLRCGARRRKHVVRQPVYHVSYSATTAAVLDAFFEQSHPRRTSFIFLSGSWRNPLQPITPSACSKVLHRIAQQSGVHQLTFCALRGQLGEGVRTQATI